MLTDGTLAILRMDFDFHDEYRRWWSQPDDQVFPLGTSTENARLRLVVFDGEQEQDVLELPPTRYPLIDRLADGRWLLVAARASEGSPNGQLLHPDGTPAGTLVLGDAVEHLRCPPDNTIWVGYFDEGVFGDPVSCGGIVHFSSAGRRLWAINDEAPEDWRVDDCYALTLDGDAMWSCAYSQFPIVKLTDHNVKAWRNSVPGAAGMAVTGTHVLLAGGYQEQFGRLALVRLSDEEATPMAEWQVAMPTSGGSRLAQGNGSTLHIVGDSVWTTIKVSEAVRMANCKG